MGRRTRGTVEILATPPTSPPPSAIPSVDDSLTTDALLQEARRGTETARNMLSMAHDTHNIAVDTAESLERQTAQLNAIKDGIDDTNEILTGAEENIEKLTKPFWRRGRSVKAEVRGWKTGREGKGGRKGKERKEENAGNGIENVVWNECYEEFDTVVGDELRTQDQILGETGVVVEELRVLAVGIGEELEKEAEIVDGIDVVQVTSRIREGNRKLRHRLKLK